MRTDTTIKITGCQGAQAACTRLQNAINELQAAIREVNTYTIIKVEADFDITEEPADGN